MTRAFVLAALLIGIATAQTPGTPPMPAPGAGAQPGETTNRGANPFGPTTPPEFALLKLVPHGEIRIVWYDSKALGVQRRLHVYLPPGYERSRVRYPVLYLLPGNGGDDAAWTNGLAPYVLDNLLAEGKARPMILVMPDARSPDPTINRPSSEATPEALAARTAASNQWRDAFINDLITGVIPFVDSSYRALGNRESRAIAGFSFGGAQALWTGTRHLDQFGWIGIFSMGIQGGSRASPGGIAGSGSAVPPDEFVKENAMFFADSTRTNKRVKLFWIGVGKDDTVVVDGPKQLADTLATHGINHEFHEFDGGHTTNNPNLHDFAERLFR